MYCPALLISIQSDVRSKCGQLEKLVYSLEGMWVGNKVIVCLNFLVFYLVFED